jgi:hypothetical protein
MKISDYEAAHVYVDAEKLKRFMDSIRSLPPRVFRSGVSPEVVAAAQDLVTAGRKALALKRHPDTGGSESEMQVLNSAHQWLTLLITQRQREEEQQ